MIQITLGKKKNVAPNSDPLQRSRIGWIDGPSDQQLHGIARGVWGMPGSRVERDRFAVVNGGGVIRQAMEIERIVDVPGGRRAFEGRVLGPGHPVHDHYVGRPAPNGAQQNPITYFDSPLGNRECWIRQLHQPRRLPPRPRPARHSRKNRSHRNREGLHRLVRPDLEARPSQQGEAA